MMKKFGLILLLILSAAVVLPGAPRFALLGEGDGGSSLADLTLAEAGDFEFVDRENLHTLLRERKLTAAELDGRTVAALLPLLRAELFARLEGKNGEAVRLTIFESGSGLRLADRLLPPDEATPQQVLAELRRTSELLEHPEKTLLLSFAGIRDRGIPDRIRAEARFRAEEVRRQIARIAPVLLTEREYLATLAAENRLTGKFGRLAASARIVTISLDPGAQTSDYGITLTLSDADGTKLLENTAPGNAASTPELLAGKLARFLHTAPPPPESPEDRAREAERFLREADWQQYSRRAPSSEYLPLYQAAWLLEPTARHWKELTYALSAAAAENSAPPVSVLLERLELVSSALEKEYPQDESELESSGREAVSSLFTLLYLRREELSDPAHNRVAELASLYRSYREKCVRNYRKWYDEKKSPTSFDFSSCLSRYCDLLKPWLWFNDAEFATGGESWFAELPVLAEQYCGPEDEIDPFGWLLPDEWFAVLPDSVAANHAERLAAACRRIPGNGIRNVADELADYADLRRNLMDDAGFAAAFRRVCEHGAGKTDFYAETQFNSVMSVPHLTEERRQRCRKIRSEVRSAFLRERAAPLSPRNQLLHSAETLRTAAGKRFGAVPPGFPAGNRNLPELATTDFCEKLNPDFTFRELSGSHFPFCAFVQSSDGTIYTAMWQGSTITFHTLNPETGTMRRIAYLTGQPFGNLDNSKRLLARLHAENGFLSFGNANTIHLIPLDGSKTRIIRDWPEEVFAAFVRDGRVWAVGPAMLISSTPDGSNRIIHLSRLREDEPAFTAFRHGSRSFTPRNLFPAEDGKILIQTESAVMLYEPGGKQLEIVGGFLPYGIVSRRAGNFILFGENNEYMTPTGYRAARDMQNRSFRHLAMPEKLQKELEKAAVHDLSALPSAASLKTEVTLPPGTTLRGPSALSGERLWCAGNDSGPGSVVRLNRPESSPGWLLPGIFAIYPHPDNRSVLLFTDTRIYKATPKDE